MRRLSLLVLVALAVVAGPAALAQGYMDLPGMGAAEKLAPAEAADTQTAEAEAPADDPQAVVAQTTAEGTVEAPDEELSAVRSMPGGGSIPVIGGRGTVEVGVGAARGSQGPDRPTGSYLLVLLAGLGSFTSVAWLVALRRQGVV